jgi:hypothetical protein
MNASSSEIRSVPVDVLPPLPRDAARQSPPPVENQAVPFANLRTFGTDFFTGFLALPEMCLLAFLASFALVLAIQVRWSKDNLPAAIGKSFLGAFLVGLPFPITGTLLGAAILALSGLPHHPVDAVKKLATRGK